MSFDTLVHETPTSSRACSSRRSKLVVTTTRKSPLAARLAKARWVSRLAPATEVVSEEGLALLGGRQESLQEVAVVRVAPQSGLRPIKGVSPVVGFFLRATPTLRNVVEHTPSRWDSGA